MKLGNDLITNIDVNEVSKAMEQDKLTINVSAVSEFAQSKPVEESKLIGSQAVDVEVLSEVESQKIVSNKKLNKARKKANKTPELFVLSSEDEEDIVVENNYDPTAHKPNKEKEQEDE